MSFDIEAIRAQRAASPESQARKLVSAIYPGVLKPYARSFFNKDNLWERRLHENILNEQPIQMVGFWGVGGKQQPNQYDERLLVEYEEIREAIKKKYSQAADMMLILAHSHGRFNGYQGFDGYLGDIAADANQRGIASKIKDNIEHHVGELEVSHVWYKYPHLIKKDKLTTKGINFEKIFSQYSQYDLFGKSGEVIDIPWNSYEQKAFAPDGSFSDSSKASPKKGKEYHDYMVNVLVDFISWLKKYKGPIGTIGKI